MLSDAERIRIYGSAEAVAEADRRGAEEVAKWPPLSPGQKARLRALLAPPTGTEPASPAPRPRAATKQAA